MPLNRLWKEELRGFINRLSPGVGDPVGDARRCSPPSLPPPVVPAGRALLASKRRFALCFLNAQRDWKRIQSRSSDPWSLTAGPPVPVESTVDRLGQVLVDGLQTYSG